MMIQRVTKNRTYVEVTLLDTNNWPDEDLVAEALKAAGESHSSIFGRDIIRYPSQSAAVVTLHTD